MNEFRYNPELKVGDEVSIHQAKKTKRTTAYRTKARDPRWDRVTLPGKQRDRQGVHRATKGGMIGRVRHRVPPGHNRRSYPRLRHLRIKP